ncbi:MAG: pseudouridine synthase [Butyricicoccaceae bacterium]
MTRRICAATRSWWTAVRSAEARKSATSCCTSRAATSPRSRMSAAAKRSRISCTAACARVVPVGRLDYNSEGLLLLTNDGDLVNGLTHPRHEVEKHYEVRVRGNMDNIPRLSEPMELDGYAIRPAGVTVLGARRGQRQNPHDHP